VDAAAEVHDPTIGSASVTPSPICAGQTVTLSAAGLANMGSTYGISFVSFAAPTATPYTGGTTLATVPNGSLTGGGTGASASVVMPAAGTYYIYAILSPVPSDPTCRPSATTSLVVNALPTATISVAETSGLSSNDGTICTGATATLTAAGGSTYAWSNGSTGAAITVSPASTTTYTVTVTTSSGCTGTASTTITVNPLPSASVAISETSGVSGNDGIICNGASATLTAAGGGTYLWSTGATTASITVTPSLTTTYNVTVTNTNGCSATASGTVTVNPLPTASVAVTETSGVSSNDGIVCNGASATLTASGGTTYLWSNGAATASINVTPSVTTIYTVTVTNANNCSATATVTITVNPLPTAC
jgi:predicted transcriptional regulator